MTLDAMVLQKIADWQPSGQGRQTLSLHDPASGWLLRLDFDRRDEFSIVLWELQICRSGEPAQGAQEAVTLWAQHASNLTGLLETLQIVEIDHQRIEALLRSSESAQRDGQIFYYEVLLKANREALVRRYRGGKPGAPREQVSFVLTHEVLAKLVRDIVTGHPAARRLL